MAAEPGETTDTQVGTFCEPCACRQIVVSLFGVRLLYVIETVMPGAGRPPARESKTLGDDLTPKGEVHFHLSAPVPRLEA